MSANFLSKGLFYEDFVIGNKILTQGRTITEADIVNFSGLTGDWSGLHTDAEFAKTLPFGQRIAHGMLTMSVATGLAILTGMVEGTVIAFESIDKWEFKRPVFIGDTIRAELNIVKKEVRTIGSNFKAGHITLQVQVKKQNGKVCQDGIWSMLVKMRGQP